MRPLKKLALLLFLITVLLIISVPKTLPHRPHLQVKLLHPALPSPTPKHVQLHETNVKLPGSDLPKPEEPTYLSTSRFAELTKTVDLGSETAIRLFHDRLTASKGLLSFPEYCYLQGRVDFAKEDFSSAARLFRQVIDVPEFIAAHPDVFYYLGTALARNPANRSDAARFLREYLVRSSKGDDLVSEAREALDKLAPLAHRPSSRNHRTTVLDNAVAQVFRADSQRAESDSPAPQVSKEEQDNGLSLHLATGHVMLDELGERLLLLHFWASWCAPCALELPRLVAFTNIPNFESRNHIKPLFITVDTFLGEGSQFVARHALHIRTLYWDKKMSVLTRLTGMSIVPVTVLYDSRQHRVVKLYPQLDWRKQTIRSEILESAARYLRSSPVHAKGGSS